MDGKQFVEEAVRNSTVVDALNSAIYAMVLTHGFTVKLDGVSGKLNFQREITKLRNALCILGADVSEPLPRPRRGRERR